jgi:hypothetical protein
MPGKPKSSRGRSKPPSSSRQLRKREHTAVQEINEEADEILDADAIVESDVDVGAGSPQLHINVWVSSFLPPNYMILIQNKDEPENIETVAEAIEGSTSSGGNDASDFQSEKTDIILISPDPKIETANAKDPSLLNEPEVNNMVTATSEPNDDNTPEPDPFAGAIRFSSEERNEETPTGENEKETESESEETWEAVSGPLSKEARCEAKKLGDYVANESERIGHKFKKSRREVILAAGLGIRSARAANPFNMYKKWFAQHNPRQKDESELVFLAFYSILKTELQLLVSMGNVRRKAITRTSSPSPILRNAKRR